VETKKIMENEMINEIIWSEPAFQPYLIVSHLCAPCATANNRITVSYNRSSFFFYKKTDTK